MKKQNELNKSAQKKAPCNKYGKRDVVQKDELELRGQRNAASSATAGHTRLVRAAASSVLTGVSILKKYLKNSTDQVVVAVGGGYRPRGARLLSGGPGALKQCRGGEESPFTPYFQIS